MRLCINLTDFDVARAKNTLMTNLALNVDTSASLCHLLGRQMIFRGRPVSWEDTAKRIMVGESLGFSVQLCAKRSTAVRVTKEAF